jgi:hypothetical protein
MRHGDDGTGTPDPPVGARAHQRIRWFSRGAAIRLAAVAAALLLGATGGWACMIAMPGTSYRGPLAPLSPAEAAVAARLRADVTHLAAAPRNLDDAAGYAAVADWIEAQLGDAGLAVTRHGYRANGRPSTNVVAERPGAERAAEIVVVGAHYDSVPACPGANDNASGVAVLLALARGLPAAPATRTLRLVAFANEEPPYFQTDAMGSLAYAKHCRERGDRIVAMLSLETMGYYSDEPGSQAYPFPLSVFYPSEGNFIAFVGDYSSRALVRQVVRSFRAHARFPSEGAALPRALPGVGWSDHWSFWQHGYPALMVTDTAPFRYPHYHGYADVAEQLDYGRLARVTVALGKVLADLGAAQP